MGWAQTHGIRHILIQPGRPMQNGYIESFNGKFRDECLNDHWFETVPQARAAIAVWRQDYNEVRPAQQLPANATRQVRRVASAACCRCNATHHRRNPLTLQPDFLPITGTPKGGRSMPILLAGLVAGLFVFFSTWFLMRYFKNREIAALRPCGIYSLVAGGLALAVHLV